MSAPRSLPWTRQIAWLVVIFLVGAFLRLYMLSEVPPGLTHDEADHGITALAILEGARDIYFTVGYGREPLYDYATALLMAFIGPHYLAGRLTAVYFSLLTLAALFGWVRHAFGSRVGLLATAGLAVGFWPVMSGRQGLRSVVLPALFTLAVYFFWRGLRAVGRSSRAAKPATAAKLKFFLIGGLLLGLTFYTYIPARALWLIFPLLLVYLLFADRPLLRRLWQPTVLMLGAALLVALPLLVFLYRTPTAEVRIAQLTAPWQAALSGDFALLLANLSGSLRLFFLEGDQTWRYNIAGKPFFGPFLALLFLFGSVLALWSLIRRRSFWQTGSHEAPVASFLSLSWLALGFAPVAVTGPELSMTQAIGLQPVLYLFPALALTFAGGLVVAARPLRSYAVAQVAVVLLFATVGLSTFRDYFLVWANEPQVRVQYEATMTAAMDYLNKEGNGVVAVSTVTPHRYHTPALAQMRLHNAQVQPRWFDARSSLLLPPVSEYDVILSGFAPLQPSLEPYFAAAEPVTTLPLRPTDLDRPLEVYRLEHRQTAVVWQGRLTSAAGVWGDSIALRGYELNAGDTAQPGEVIELITLWEVLQPVDDVVLFIHLVDENGIPLAQRDLLGVPGENWVPGDLFLQVHTLPIPEELDGGAYDLLVGVYIPEAGRLPLEPDVLGDDRARLTEVVVAE